MKSLETMRSPSVRYALFAVLLGALLAAAVVPAAAQPTPIVDESLYQGLKWRNIGPFRGGRSNASTGVPSQPHTFYFGGVGSGVWKTTDGGENWRHLHHEAFNTASVGAIEVSLSDPNVVYVGMGEHAVRGVMTSHGDGVYRSDDAGVTWRHLGLKDSRHISAVRVHPDDPNVVYVAAQGAAYGTNEQRGVFRSRDGGVTWEKVLYVSDSAGASGLSMSPTNPRLLYAAFWDHIRLPWQVRSGGPGSSVWKSIDGGDTWERLGETVENGLPAVKGKISVSVSPDPNRVFALVEADPGGGLYRSDDGGKTWANVNADWGLRARAWYYIKVFADPSDRDVVWITNARTYKSIDGGKSFATVRTPHGDNHHLWIHPEDSDILINSNDGGANVSYNGGRTWSTQQNQPTGQFYRVITDNQFPYHVYGGQQDNSAIGIVSEAPGGIGWSDFYSIAGCESASPAFDPDEPMLVYGGCYMGILAEWNRETDQSRDVMAYPNMAAGIPAREQKYRFNWNAPLVASPHNRSVLYHGANVLLRSDNRGVTWTPISPDLTRNEDEKQGPGGGPITNEGAGGEIYGTIYAVAASETEPGVLWVGTDDGRIHITRDEGQNWEEITPPDVGEAIINALEISPHDPATAYAAVTRYKFNDMTPLAYRTTDYGKSWEQIAKGIPDGAWVRVIREDPVRAGLLYMGTELGAYISFDAAATWQPLALNMPVTAITDLVVQREHNDLVASTSGRAFWILDNLAPLQQLDASTETTSLQMFQPDKAHLASSGGGFGFARSRIGQNPPGMAVLDLIVPLGDGDEELEIDITDSSGSLVRRFRGTRDRKGEGRSDEEPAQPETSEASPEEGEEETPKKPKSGKKSVLERAEESTLTKVKIKAGHNRIAWNGRHDSVLPIPGQFNFGSLAGRDVIPGTYTVTARLGDAEVSQDVDVLADPRVAISAEQFAAQDALIQTVDTELASLHRAVIELREVRGQIERFLDASSGHEASEEIAEAGREIVKGLTGVEDTLIQKKTVDGQTVINFPARLNHHYLYLRSAIGESLGLVTDGMRERAADLSEQLTAALDDLGTLLGEDLDAFNALVREKEVPAIARPVQE
ncbi:MAG: glycosyl hydrolase [Acidobacteriota bacterium]